MEGEHWLWILQTLIKRAKKKSKANYACLIIMFLLSLLEHYNIKFNDYDPNGDFFSQPLLIWIRSMMGNDNPKPPIDHTH